MGLDGVEFIMEVEDAFQVAIPDDVASSLRTPRNLVDYLGERLAGEGERVCLEQRAFHRLRRAAIRVFGTSRGEVASDTRWDAILPSRQRRRNWQLLGRAASISPWPRLSIWGGFRPWLTTVGSTSRHVATHAPASLRHESERWSRSEVEAVVARLMRECLGIKEFGWDQEFVKDLGVN